MGAEGAIPNSKSTGEPGTNVADMWHRIEHPILQRMYRYWDAKRGGRRYPSRADIDPMDFKFALGRVSLVDVLRDPLRFRYRIVATQLTEHLGYEMTGKLADEIPEPDVRDYTILGYTRAVAAESAVHDAGEIVVDRRRWTMESLFLPLSTDGSTIDMLLVCRITERPKKL